MTSTPLSNAVAKNNSTRIIGLLFVFFAGVNLHIARAQTLFTYNGKVVTVQEFMQAFDKNPVRENRKQALEEYLPLYINYKLKVQQALDLRMDTLSSQRSEVANYVSQLKDNAMNRLVNVEGMVKTALERANYDIKTAYLQLPYNEGDPNSERETLAAAKSIQQRLIAGEGFDQVLNDAQRKYRAAGGNLGWVTVFTLPYRFENALYLLEGKAKVTNPIKTERYFTIFQKLDQRPAAGKVKLAQILIQVSPKMPLAQQMAAQQKADSLYRLLLQAPEQFGDLAREHSDDRSSYAQGGLLPEISVGQYNDPFESEAFALKAVGDIRAPFQTEFGFHIIRLLGKSGSYSANRAEAEEWARQKINADDRLTITRQQMVKNNLTAWGYKPISINKAALFAYSDSSRKGSKLPVGSMKPQSILFYFGKEKTTVENWIYYLQAIAKPGQLIDYNRVYDSYVLQTAELYYRNNLVTLDPNYKTLVKEFSESNLVFELADKEVWSAASNDFAGQKNFFKSHQELYTWKAGAQALLAVSQDSAKLALLRDEIVKNPQNWMQLKADAGADLYIDSSRYEWGQLSSDNFNSNQIAGGASAIKPNDMDNSYSFTYIFSVMPGGDQKSFEDAQGWVVNDFQQSLEQDWIAKLRKQYPVKIDEEGWKQLLQKQLQLANP